MVTLNLVEGLRMVEILQLVDVLRMGVKSQAAPSRRSSDAVMVYGRAKKPAMTAIPTTRMSVQPNVKSLDAVTGILKLYEERSAMTVTSSTPTRV